MIRADRPNLRNPTVGTGQRRLVLSAFHIAFGALLRSIFERAGRICGAGTRCLYRRSVFPTLSSGDIVIMDNLPAHKVAGVRDAIAAALIDGLMADAHGLIDREVDRQAASNLLRAPG